MLTEAVPTTAPTLMDAREAARALEASLKNPEGPMTVADAAARSGLALRDVERGLSWLTHEYRGHLRVTEEGQLVYLFPTGFTKPWQTRDAITRALAATGKVLAGVARFVVRAWLTLVIFAYAGIFVAVLIALTLARQGSSDRDDGFPGASIGYVLLRVLGDALFWMFHPFSPLAIGAYDRDPYASGGAWDRQGRSARAERDETPFYEKVNRFVFGPTQPQDDPRAMEQRLLAEVRAQKGRIGLADVMRVTGLPRAEADPMMARLMLDYDGEVDVSEGGGITYRFEAIRKTASEARERSPAPAWSSPRRTLPLTGNTVGSNLLVGMLNGFNLIMALFALQENLTVARIVHIVQTLSSPEVVPIPMPYDGVPVVLGVVPLVFSIALFLLPLGRALTRSSREKAIAHENGRLGLLREILSRVEARAPLTEPALRDAWKRAAGQEPTDKELTRAIVDLGGDVDLREPAPSRTGPRVHDEPAIRYRFIDLETEAEALEEERAAASEEEAKLGKIVFASDR